jgi:hypothetical protein
VLCLVVICVAGMGVHYDATFEEQWPYPTGDELATDYDAHVGQETFLFGTAVSVDDETARIRVDADAGTYTLRVRSFDATVDPGGTVQLLGVVRPDGVLVADRVVVVESSGGSRLYKYGVSVLGAGLVLVAFFRHWRIDTERLTLEARDG